MANLCIKTPSSAILVLIFQLLVLRPRPNRYRLPITQRLRGLKKGRKRNIIQIYICRIVHDLKLLQYVLVSTNIMCVVS